MQWPTGLMILRGQGLSMTNRQEDICNSRVAFATEITENTVTYNLLHNVKYLPKMNINKNIINKLYKLDMV